MGEDEEGFGMSKQVDNCLNVVYYIVKCYQWI